MTELTRQQQIEAGERVRNFLRDDAVKAVLETLEVENRKSFLESETDEARRSAWAEARVLGRFTARLIGVMDDGERARADNIAEDKRLMAPDAR